MTTTLVLLRHGETDLNARGIFQGQLDEPLNELGRSQAQAIAPAIAAMTPSAIYSSDLVRARETAAAIAELTGLGVHSDARLGEINCGTWQGRTFAEVSEENPNMVALLRAGKDFRRSATGETEAEVAGRVGECLEWILPRHPGETIVVVGHGLAICVGAAALIGLPPQCAGALGTMLNCHYGLVRVADAHARLSAWNLGA